MEVSGQLNAPAAELLGERSSVPIGLKSGWAPESTWTMWGREEALVSAGNRTLAVQPLTRRYAG
jgi:hypothetical protein